MPHSTPRKRAIKYAAGMTRPESIGRVQWRGVQTLLLTIAQHYPKPYPSQERLAEITGFDVRSIRRYQKAAVVAGLLHVTPDAGVKGEHNTWSKTNLYALSIEDSLSGMSEDSLSSKAPSGHYVPLQGVASLSHSSNERTQPGPPSAGSTNVIPMRRDQEPSRQVSKKAPATKRASDYLSPGHGNRQEPKAPAKKERWRVHAEYFSDRWRDLIAQPDNRDLRDVRDVETKAQCKAYFNAHLVNYSNAEVRQYMDEFFRLVSQRHVRLKSGQSAWLAFTGAWGRQRTMIDPAVASRAIQEYRSPQERAQ